MIMKITLTKLIYETCTMLSPFLLWKNLLKSADIYWSCPLSTKLIFLPHILDHKRLFIPRSPKKKFCPRENLILRKGQALAIVDFLFSNVFQHWPAFWPNFRVDREMRSSLTVLFNINKTKVLWCSAEIFFESFLIINVKPNFST